MTGGARQLAVAALAPWGIAEDLRKLRAICPRSGRPTIDACVLIRPAFSAAVELSALVSSLDSSLSSLPPFVVRALDPRVLEDGQARSVVMPIEDPGRAAELVRRVSDALSQAGVPAWQDPPLMPIVEDVTPEGAARTLRAIEGWRLNMSWAVRDVDVLELEGDKWRSCARLHFGKVRAA